MCAVNKGKGENLILISWDHLWLRKYLGRVWTLLTQEVDAYQRWELTTWSFIMNRLQGLLTKSHSPPRHQLHSSPQHFWGIFFVTLVLLDDLDFFFLINLNRTVGECTRQLNTDDEDTTEAALVRWVAVILSEHFASFCTLIHQPNCSKLWVNAAIFTVFVFYYPTPRPAATPESLIPTFVDFARVDISIHWAFGRLIESVLADDLLQVIGSFVEVIIQHQQTAGMFSEMVDL